MNGLHDIGGMQGFGPIVPQEDWPPFEHEWERRVFGALISLIANGYLSMDEARWGVERMDPVYGLANILGEESYYWRWLYAIEIVLAEKGYLSEGEIQEAMRNIDEESRC